MVILAGGDPHAVIVVARPVATDDDVRTTLGAASELAGAVVDAARW